MWVPYKIVIDPLFIKDLSKIKDKQIHKLIEKIIDKLEKKGLSVGKLLDNKLRLHGIKLKRPPLRIYFVYSTELDSIILYQVHLKRSAKIQRKIIKKLKEIISNSCFFSCKMISFRNIFLHLQNSFIQSCIAKSFDLSLHPLIFLFWDSHHFHASRRLLTT